MSGDANSDTLEYRPSFRTFIESNYWSDDNCCMSKSDHNTINWSPLDNHSAEEKNDIMADAEQTLGKDDMKNDPNINNKNSKSVHFDNSINIINDNNFAPGSNISPSLLNDDISNQNNSNDNNTQLSGKKRTVYKSKQKQNNENYSPPSAKRMRFSNRNDNVDVDVSNNMMDNGSGQDNLTYDQLQDIQNSEREKFQAELQAAGLQGHVENPYQFQPQQNYVQQHGTNDNTNDNNNNQSNKRNSTQQSSNRNTGDKRSSNSRRRDRRRTSAGGGPGGDSSDDGDEDKNNKDNNDNDNDNNVDSDSESQDSDVETGKNITNKVDTNVEQLQKQNENLKKQLADSNNRIDDLLNQITSANSNSKNGNVANKGTVPPNICELNIYKEMIKQQQLQMTKLMRCVAIIVSTQHIYSKNMTQTKPGQTNANKVGGEPKILHAYIHKYIFDNAQYVTK